VRGQHRRIHACEAQREHGCIDDDEVPFKRAMVIAAQNERVARVVRASNFERHAVYGFE